MMKYGYRCALALLSLGLNGFLRANEPAPAPDHSKVPGVVIAHSPQSSGIYIGSPGIAVLPDGTYLAKLDEFGPESTEKTNAITRVFQSTDKGKSWEQISRIERLFWANIFYHRGALYLMGTSASHRHGHCVIRKSTDGGRTWTEAKDENSGLLSPDISYHTAPMPMVIHNGRIWRAMEDEKGGEKWGSMFRAYMMSAPVDADLLRASNWTSSNALAHDPSYLGGKFGGWLEGNAVLDPQGNIVNILRVSAPGPGKAAIIRISGDGRKATFDPERDFIDFPGGSKKFVIRPDSNGVYWSLANYVPPVHGNAFGSRNTVALIKSKDLREWEVCTILLYHPQATTHGFQYLDWMFDGNDLIAVSRTAFDDGVGGAHRTHDANYLTFHRWKNFQSLTMKDSVVAPSTLRIEASH